MQRIGLILLSVVLAPTAASAQQRSAGILNDPAPSWSLEEWINLPSGKSTLDIDDFRGKVLYLYCFQSWCPGCHRHGFPTLQKVIARFKDDRDVAFVAIQTVFEGFSSNTFDHAKKVAKRYALDIPVGQSGEQGRRSKLMGRYRTGGTPWTVIIDRDGVVRFNDFHIDVEQAAQLIDNLRRTPAHGHQGSGVPPSSTGRDLIGKPFPLERLAWVNTPDGQPISVKGKVTLVRWWTNTCPFCERSLPQIAKFRAEFGRRGFQTVCVYHPKPPRHVANEDIVRAAANFGYTGPLALDADWQTLEEFYLSERPWSSTSVSFLLDREGKVRFVHPGPALYPTSNPRDSEINREFENTKKAIEALLAE